jgi:hypothetical protein
MKPWTRDDTKEWIAQLEHRIEDIDYYLKKTVEWCEDHYVYDDRKVFMLSFLTVIWVSHMRNEPISYVELLEILGMPEMIVGEDKIYELNAEFENFDHEQILEMILKNLNSGGNYLPS